MTFIEQFADDFTPLVIFACFVFLILFAIDTWMSK